MAIKMEKYFNPEFISESSYPNLFIIESCYDSICEGAFDTRTVSISERYSRSIIFEVLDNIKEALLQFVQKLLYTLTQTFVNYNKVFLRYREAVLDRFYSLTEPLIYETYEYPKSGYKYPNMIHTNGDIEKAVVKLQDDIISGKLTAEKVAYRVDTMINSFGKEVTDFPIDPLEIGESVKRNITNQYRGKMITTQLDKDSLAKFMEDLNRYKADKDDLMYLKKTIIEEYTLLKDTYKKVTSDPIKMTNNYLRNMTDPEKEALEAHEYQRFANISMEMSRLFNGYITVYQTAFNTKLNLFNERIDHERAMIVEVLSRTGVFTTLNTKRTTTTTGKIDKPIPYKPKWVH